MPDLDARANLRDAPPPITPTPIGYAPSDEPSALSLIGRTPAPPVGFEQGALDSPAALRRRLSADLALAESLRVQMGGFGLDPSRPDAFGSGHLALRDGAAGGPRRLSLVDLALAWDAPRSDPDSPLTLSLLGGVSAMHHALHDPSPRDDADTSFGFNPRADSGLAAAPLAGLRLRWDLPGGVYLRTGTAWRVTTDPEPAQLNLSADLGYEISRRVDLSVGYERTRASFSASAFDAGVRQDFVFARVSLRF